MLRRFGRPSNEEILIDISAMVKVCFTLGSVAVSWSNDNPTYLLSYNLLNKLLAREVTGLDLVYDFIFHFYDVKSYFPTENMN